MTHGHGRPMIFFVLKLKSRLQSNNKICLLQGEERNPVLGSWSTARLIQFGGGGGGERGQLEMGEDACSTFQGSKSVIWYLLRRLKL